MSIELVARVLNTTTGLSGSAKWVLIGLAEHAGPDGESVFPSVARIAAYVETDVRTVQRSLRVLEREGWIETVSKARGKRPTEYRIRGDRLSVLGARGDIQGPEGVTLVSQGGDTHVTLNRHEPSENLQHEDGKPKRSPRPRDPVWDGLVEWLGRSPQTETERGKWNRAAKELRQVGVDSAEEVVRRGRALMRVYPNITPSPMALAANLSVTQTAAPRRVPTREEQMAELGVVVDG